MLATMPGMWLKPKMSSDRLQIPGGQLPLGIDGHIRYTPTTETIGDWSSARVNEPFVHEPRPQLRGAAIWKPGAVSAITRLGVQSVA